MFFIYNFHSLTYTILQRGWRFELMVGQVHSKIEDHLTKLKKHKTDKPALENNIKNHV